ncbi:hypothetical protein GRI62_05520 [Erythrobacter arachoides]|uniref:SMP-30/Gluconolactonase/LRE-like region domain-containing protein n=1 Tax=Aurantiacibacter arachoides TaxID=1850444 RepID=A0A845A024_9SPHN|nr:hypothetical protein [Aurantiacibacter arachoides]MXO93064.1 hypothetical protein [Aurantiacibacter arachoides]GGD52304.1 hypothetical protein GCM10011411_10220 [Aurantiacibacter arachoides]
MRRVALALSALAVLAGCASRIELPGSVLALETAPGVRAVGAPVDWHNVDAATGLVADVPGLEALAEAFPDSASVRLRLLQAYLAAGDRAGVATAARWLRQREHHLPPAAQDAVVAMVGSADAGQLPGGSPFSEPVEASALVSTIGPHAQLPEAFLFDPATGREFVTTVVSRAVFIRHTEAGGGAEAWSEVTIPGAGSLGGIALDAARGLLWVGSGVLEQTPDPHSVFRGVIGIDRDTLAVMRRVAAPVGVTIADIGVAPDGTVYGSDPLGGGIYGAAPDSTEMHTLVPPGTFRSPQGIAVRPTGRSLFVSDYRHGLAEVTLGPRPHVYRVQTALPAALDGIDGLWIHDNDLIAVQNGLSPARIVAFRLGEGIANIANHRVLERANPAWTEPLGGAMTGGALYYVGNGSWGLYGRGGQADEGQTAEGRGQPVTRLHRLDLRVDPPRTP